MEPVLEGMGPYSVSQVHNHPGDKDMSELRDEIIATIKSEAESNWNLDVVMMSDDELGKLADRILSLPRIAEALAISAKYPDGDYRDYLLRRGRWSGVPAEAGYV
jgi:hypothetical protein